MGGHLSRARDEKEAALQIESDNDNAAGRFKIEDATKNADVLTASCIFVIRAYLRRHVHRGREIHNNNNNKTHFYRLYSVFLLPVSSIMSTSSFRDRPHPLHLSFSLSFSPSTPRLSHLSSDATQLALSRSFLFSFVKSCKKKNQVVKCNQLHQVFASV